jgi:hypothetical protein
MVPKDTPGVRVRGCDVYRSGEVKHRGDSAAAKRFLHLYKYPAKYPPARRSYTSRFAYLLRQVCSFLTKDERG